MALHHPADSGLEPPSGRITPGKPRHVNSTYDALSTEWAAVATPANAYDGKADFPRLAPAVASFHDIVGSNLLCVGLRVRRGSVAVAEPPRTTHAPVLQPKAAQCQYDHCDRSP